MTTTDSTITYKDIPGFPGYRAGDDGSIWSCWRRKGRGWGLGSRAVMSPSSWTPMTCLKPAKCGHLRVNIKRKIFFVHRLVLMAFVGPCPNGMECCHNDGNPTNNRLDNLRWDTRKSNMVDQLDHGVMPQGEQRPNAKLTDDEVRAIRMAQSAGEKSPQILAKQYQVSVSTIKDIIQGRTWKHISSNPHGVVIESVTQTVGIH